MCISGSRGSRCRGSIDWFQVCGMAPHSRAPVHCAGPCWELKWRLYFDPLTLLSTEVTYILTLHRAENWSGVIWGVTRGSFRRHLGGHLGSHLGGDLGGHMGRHLEVIWGSPGGICVCVYIYIHKMTISSPQQPDPQQPEPQQPEPQQPEPLRWSL